MVNHSTSKKLPIGHRLARVTLVTWVRTITVMLIQVLSVPICLHFWGKSTYGLWLATFAAFDFMRTIDYGYTVYSGNLFNVLFHKDDNELRLMLASAIWGVTILGIIQIILLVILYLCHGLGLIVNNHTNFCNNDTQIFLALLIMSICWVTTASYIGIVHRLLTPLAKLSESILMMLWLQGAQFIALILAAVFKMSILSTAIMFATVQVIFHISSAVYVKSLLPQYYPWWQNSKAKIGIINIIRALPLTISGIITQGGTNALILLVASMLGPAIVPVFTTSRTIANLWTTLINSVAVPMQPEMVGLYAKKNWSGIVLLNKVNLTFTSIGVNISLLICYPLIGFIFGIWTKHQLPFNHSLIEMLLVAIIMSGISTLMSTFFIGINNHAYVIIISFIRGCMVLLISWLLIATFGIAGLGYAIAAGESMVLVVTYLWIFEKDAEFFIGKTIRLLLSWPGLSSASVVAYFLKQSFLPEFASQSLYLLTFFIVIVSTFFSWHNLDINVKAKIKLWVQQSIPGNSV